VIAIADSGHNTANKNTGNGEVISGDANVGLTVVNVANTNIAGVKTSEYDIYDDHKGDIVVDLGGGQSASNEKTGADSSNQANTDSNTSLTIVNNNDAKVANDLVINATTGHNTADKNTGDGTVKTGDVNVVANVVNVVNNNLAAGTEILVATVNVFGDLVGDIILAPLTGSSQQAAGNSNTGAGSVNESSTAVNRINETLQNNEANINNAMLINANTGDNNADKNTGEGSVTTGEVKVQAQEMTVANNNLTGSSEDTWWIVVVNEAGKWVGKIMGADDGGNVAVMDTIDLEADNNNTGADSTNQASAEHSAEQNTVQNNTADVNNNLVINANTGDNSAEKNTGSSSIETGDVNIYSNVVNYVNNNYAGGKVVVAFVNVFGSWVGDLITPGNEKDNSANNEQGIVNSDNSSSEHEQEVDGPKIADEYNLDGEDDKDFPLAIGGPESVPEFGNYYGDDYEINNESEEEEYHIYSTADRIRRAQNTLLGRETEVVSDEPDERVLAGMWMVEDDEYLKTTPTPTIAAQKTDEENTVGNENKLVWMLLMSGPLGWGAWSLKRKIAIDT